MGEKFAKWIIFGVLLSLAPLLFSVIQLSARDRSGANASVIEDVLGGGGLLLISAAIAVAGVGELVAAKNSDIYGIISGGGLLPSWRSSVRCGSRTSPVRT